MFKRGSKGFYIDELLYAIGFLIGRRLVVVLGFLTGYVGINVLIGILRWFVGVVF